MSEWIKKHNPTISCLQETYLKYQYKETHRLKEKGWKILCHTNTDQKKIKVGILISHKETST